MHLFRKEWGRRVESHPLLKDTLTARPLNFMLLCCPHSTGQNSVRKPELPERKGGKFSRAVSPGGKGNGLCGNRAVLATTSIFSVWSTTPSPHDRFLCSQFISTSPQVWQCFVYPNTSDPLTPPSLHCLLSQLPCLPLPFHLGWIPSPTIIISLLAYL